MGTQFALPLVRLVAVLAVVQHCRVGLVSVVPVNENNAVMYAGVYVPLPLSLKVPKFSPDFVHSHTSNTPKNLKTKVKNVKICHQFVHLTSLIVILFTFTFLIPLAPIPVSNIRNYPIIRDVSGPRLSGFRNFTLFSTPFILLSPFRHLGHFTGGETSIHVPDFVYVVFRGLSHCCNWYEKTLYMMDICI